MKEVEERTCKICGMKFKTNDGRVKTCHRHKSRYNEDMKKEPKTLTEAMLAEHKKAKKAEMITLLNFILNCVIAFGVTCNLILNIVK